MKIGVLAHNRDFWGAKTIHIPLLYSLYCNYPDSDITVLTPYENNRIFLKTGLVNDVVYYKSNFFDILKVLRSYGFDLLISLRNRSLALNLGIYFSKSTKKIGFKGSILDFVYDKSIIYRKDIYRAIAFNSLIADPMPIDGYFRRFEPESRLNEIKAKKIFIISGAGGGFKKWGIDKFIEVCEKIDKNFYYIFVCGEGEKDDIEFINIFLKRHNGEIFYNREIDEMIRFFHTGDLFISNDTGPSHIARMMHKPIITLYSNLYGDADQVIKEWFLSYENAYYLVSDLNKGIESIKVDDVVSLVNKILM